MSEPRDCPRCQLVNPPDARRCDCGYYFEARQVVGSHLPRDEVGAIGQGSTALLGCWLGPVGMMTGAGAGVPLRLWLAQDDTAPGGCGLSAIGMAIEGLLYGGFAGGLAGALLTLLIARRLGRPA